MEKGRFFWGRFLVMLMMFCGVAGHVHAQTPAPQPPDPRYGPNDTIIVPIYVLRGDTLPAGTLQYVYVDAPMPPAMRKRYEKWTRLRNAVYVTYPYARKAGVIINDINAKLATLPEGERKAYIKSREEELKKEFTAPLTKLSVYQGRVLMKLINRQTGNNCYELIKEYRGGFQARFWQTVAFFFNSSLKQPYDAYNDDREIEMIVREVEKMYH
ncbi:DUF4294 domain-containing protein [Flavihumibacter petaseus]|uniref:DUF4294 domain-containing protein n=1 Tax=Flavihumibacter petaseus NBRC 106054 TaxID=1220578 RepID=A0A0E9N551_9BACT|nr:DUF4294 domain-containing protein [Flavihumibacter petaseus]GAO44475.1 hypothetical protein FPE01S_03_05120 [Flavihumibacter petaseus NBRC 106054]